MDDQSDKHNADRSSDVSLSDRFTLRDEANALVAWAFRNGPLEDLHAGKQSELLDDPALSHITDAEMKALMINASPFDTPDTPSATNPAVAKSMAATTTNGTLMLRSIATSILTSELGFANGRYEIQLTDWLVLFTGPAPT